MDKRYQIFISSTYNDLKEERDKVMRAVLQLKCFPAGMELFPASDIKQFEYIKSVIDECDYYILIIGARYGSLDKNGVSYTEKEYNYAVRKKIPVLAFLQKDFESLLKKGDIDKELLEKLKKFRSKVEKGGRIVNYWDTPDDLKAKVTISLKDAFDKHKRIGWVKADKVQSGVSQDEFDELQNEYNNLKNYLKTLEADNNRIVQSQSNKLINDEQEWDKEYTLAIRIKYRYSALDSQTSIIELKDTLKNWFIFTAEVLMDKPSKQSHHILEDINYYFSEDPSFTKEVLKKEESKIRAEWFKSYPYQKPLPNYLSASELWISHVSIEKNDWLIIKKALIRFGLLTDYYDFDALTVKGEKIYESR